jgi:NAD(P)H-flavin reductase
MSRALDKLKDYLLKEGQYVKLWKNHTPGQRVVPSASSKNNENFEVRVDAGEMKDGEKYAYLQAN